MFGVDLVWKKRSRDSAAVVVEVGAAVGMGLGVVERERVGREGVTLAAAAWPKRRGER